MSGKDTSTIGNPIEETRQYHTLYLRAINNPLRRKILRALGEGYATVEDLQSRTGLDVNALNWHLSMLERGLCVEKDTKEGKTVYKRTQEGRVVDHLE